ncbi:MAG: hypothetical protein IJU84_02485, partial [Clostridia bacterium]|nr:hypothetical protein [Clostridia bacterium]
METRKRVATIEEYVISMQAAVCEEPYAEEEYVAPVEEFVAEEPVELAPVAVTEEVPAADAEKKLRAPAKPFDLKIVTADEITQDRYNELKNYAMQYKKLKSRVSKKFDSLNKGRVQFVKFGLAGRTLKVYLNLKLDEVEPKYHCKDQSFKKPYVQVPVLIRVKSGRAVKYAKKLMDQCAESLEFQKNPKYAPQDYIAEMEEIYKANQEKGGAADEEEVAVT